jgi:hypothetical protein
VPVLARTFEAAGISTVLVTPMPYWSEKIGLPRTLAVEFPFGHALGQPGDGETQMTVIRSALAMLTEATAPGEVRELDLEWPQPFDEAKKDWQPSEPSPVVKMMLEQRRAQALKSREQGG